MAKQLHQYDLFRRGRRIQTLSTSEAYPVALVAVEESRARGYDVLATQHGTKPVIRFAIVRVPLKNGYTTNGSYFGVGAPLFAIEAHTADGEGMGTNLRAADRAAAIRAFQATYPDVTVRFTRK